MRFPHLIIPLIAMACRSPDDGLKAYNSLPQISIQSHSDGSILLEGQTENFYALATDSNHSPGELEVAWFYGGELVCDWSVPDEGGSSNRDITPVSTEPLVRAEVRDPENAGGNAEVLIDVEPSYAPEIEILSPDSETEYAADELIHFSAQLSDAEDPVETLVAEWQSSIDGTLEINTTPDSSGQISDYALLSAGEHVLSLRVSDSMGKSTLEEVIVSVREANVEPQCSITSPASSSSGEEGRNVVFEGEVSDPDGPLSDLSITWSSDKDGALGTSIASANGDGTGSVIFTTSDLTINSHIITMQVEDAYGGICNSNILYSVGSPPSLVLLSPNNNDVFAQSENIVFEAEVSDAQDVPADLSLEWYSDQDGIFSTTGPNSSGVAQFNYSQLSAGTHNITVTATDSDGLYDTALASIRINSVPTQPSVSLTPMPAYTTDALLAVASGSTDADNDPITYFYEWWQNGVLSGQTTASVPNSATVKNDIWTVRVTPNDGYGDGPYVESTLTIVNSTPVVNTVAINPTSVTTQSTLTCTYSSSDADGDPLSETVQWLINGNVDGNTTNTLTGPFGAGDVIICRVVANDGTISSVPVDASVTVNNSAPVVQSIAFTPASVYTNDQLMATATVTDPDNDPMTYSWNWYVDDGNGFSMVFSDSTTQPTSNLDGTLYFDRDDNVYVDFTASDTSTSTTLTSTTTTILNTAPSVFNALITPLSPVAGLDDLECVVQSSDSDGDAVNIQYAWTLNGGLTTYTNSTITANNIADGEIWECTVTCDDGTSVGNSVSAITTIGANNAEAVGFESCSAADSLSNGSNTIQTCAASQSVTSGVLSGSTHTLQLGSHYVYSPE